MAPNVCRGMSRISMVLLIAVCVFAPRTANPSEPLIAGPGLVTTDWLAASLGNAGLRIIDARGSLGPYLQGHVPGAVFLHTESLRLSTGGIPGKLLPPDELAVIFGRVGVSNDTPVVVYSAAEDAFAAAAYIATVLEYLGHKQVAVLDGGFDKWQQEARNVSKDFPSVPQGRFAPAIHQEMMVTAEGISKSAQSSSVIVLDARPPQQHAAGHIPKSANLPLRDLLTSSTVPTWKSVEEIRQRAAKAGVTATTPVIAYCNSGREASQLAFTLRHVLGLKDVSVYDGSMIDWSARKLPKEVTPTTSTVAR
jgi:thiosulfate/3-mercaptopyruvate sulfurtransferase